MISSLIFIMPPKKRKIQAQKAAIKSVKKWQSQSYEAKRKRKQRRRKYWLDVLESFDSKTSSIDNRKGHVRSYDEN